MPARLTDQTLSLAQRQTLLRALPFSSLSAERLNWLVSKTEVITVPANTIIFHQGDIGDRCYVIQTGEVEVIAHEPDEPDHILSRLKSPAVFGEATLIANTTRNATVRAITDCVLLMLKHEYLSELMEAETVVADLFMQLMIDRSRPTKNPAVSFHPRITAKGESIIILKNPENGNYFKLAKEGWFIWQQLDGRQTLQEITFSLAEKFNTFEPDRIAALILKLVKKGFVHNVAIEDEQGEHKPLWVRAMLRMRRILEARITIKHADQWISKIYNKVAYVFFTRPGKYLLALLGISGLISFTVSTPKIIYLFQTAPVNNWLFLWVFPLMIVSVALHELGHAMATKFFGYEVQYVGIGWYWLGPIAFTDTSDMWLGKRWPRIIVNLAGVIVDSVTAGSCALLLWIIPNQDMKCFLWIFALYTYINAFRMLSPLQDMDGYYILMDLFDRPRLRQLAVVWLSKGLPAALRHPRLFRKNKAVVCYWLACILFLIAVTLLTLWIQGFVFKILHIQAGNLLVSLALPFLLVVISSLGILADIRNQR